MLDGIAWHDICILNCSLHGLGIQSAKAPERGVYVEIRRGRQTIVARVAWSKGHRAGLKAQDPIFAAALISGNDAAPAAPEGAAGVRERRVQPRSSAQAHATSRSAGRAMEFACFAIVAAAIALAGASAVGDALARPMHAVESALL